METPITDPIFLNELFQWIIVGIGIFTTLFKKKNP